MRGPPLLVATRNDHKLDELAEILDRFELEPMPKHLSSPEETGESFAANALIKARACCEETGRPALADDSGIAAAALEGRPGVRSARYAGERASDEENLTKLLGDLDRHRNRSVAYVCVLAFVAPDGTELLAEGRCEGTLATEPRGGGGFGYDPAFVPADTPADDRRTMAELSPAEKHAISHRGRAARRIAAMLEPSDEVDTTGPGAGGGPR